MPDYGLKPECTEGRGFETRLPVWYGHLLLKGRFMK